MKHRGRFISNTVSRMHVITEPLKRLPLVELTGDGRILIENHRGVTVYSLQEIRVSVAYGQICVYGSHMLLAHMTSERLLITGCIDSIQLCRRC